jgi:MPBQ/MSBQ methyltransferase
MRLIQHKREAYWFYRFLSLGYDDWVNPLFWTPQMRDQALAAARLDRRDLETLDAGAGTGFTTEGIVAHVDGERVTMLDQSPHQLARAARRPGLGAVRRLLGDAEALPFGDDAFDRYVSAGSIEYWPDPQRGIAEAYRVVREGGVATVIGPVRPAGRLARALADLWMLFPEEAQYLEWFERAGFTGVELHPASSRPPDPRRWLCRRPPRPSRRRSRRPGAYARPRASRSAPPPASPSCRSPS